MKPNSLFLNHGSEMVRLCCAQKGELTWIRAGHFSNEQLHTAPQKIVQTADEEIYLQDKLLIKRQGEFKNGRLVYGSILRNILDEGLVVSTVFYHGRIATSVAAVDGEPLMDPCLWSYKDPVSYELKIDQWGVHRAFIYNNEQKRQDYALELILEEKNLIGIKIVESRPEYVFVGIELRVDKSKKSALYIHDDRQIHLNQEQLRNHISFKTFIVLDQLLQKMHCILASSLKLKFQSSLEQAKEEYPAKPSEKKVKRASDRTLTEEQRQLIEDDLRERRDLEKLRQSERKKAQAAAKVRRDQEIQMNLARAERAREAKRQEQQMHLEATSPQREADRSRHVQRKMRQKHDNFFGEQHRAYHALLTSEQELRKALTRHEAELKYLLMHQQVARRLQELPHQEHEQRSDLHWSAFNERLDLEHSFLTQRAGLRSSLWQPQLMKTALPDPHVSLDSRFKNSSEFHCSLARFQHAMGK